VLQPGGEPDLADEPVDPDGACQLGVEDLDRDQPLVPEVPREPDGRHPAAAQLALNSIPVGQRSVNRF
jgi:hypothetical protein